MQISTILLTAVLALTTQVAAGNLNCHEKSDCKHCGVTLSDLNNSMQNVDSAKVFKNGENIACIDCKKGSGKLCAIPHHTSKGMTGATAKSLYDSLVSHKCQECGDAKVGAKQKGAKGELEVKYIK